MQSLRLIGRRKGREDMARSFNVTGSCDPQLHYMVDITGRLEKIKGLIDRGKYFTINRARQYGKTTTIDALTEYLKSDYIVISLDFQLLGNAKFATEHSFSLAFSEYLQGTVEDFIDPILGLDNTLIDQMVDTAKKEESFALDNMFPLLSKMCYTAEKPVVLIIDEVDSATNNQVFLDFLAQLRGYYLKRRKKPTFQSVVLAGVVDVKNIKMKLRPQSEHKLNSPWNIATDFLIDMSFSVDDIKGMLGQYEEEHHTEMDTDLISGLISDSTSGYPFLVSRLCQLIDERIAGSEQFPDEKSAWTKAGYLEAEKRLIAEKNTLFESLADKLMDYPELKTMLSVILFSGKDIPYVATNHAIEIATMFGFVKNEHNIVRVANRIFESVLYNHLLSDEIVNSEMYDLALVNKLQFTQGRHLNMKLILENFVKAFTEVSHGKDEKFLEEEGRKYFMLYLKPIINGIGHSYVEARTRNLKRTDLVVDYLGEQFVIEMKIWDGPKYHAEGEQQVAEYLDYYGLKKGYMLIFNFNKYKEIGVKEIQYGDRVLVEAVV